MTTKKSKPVSKVKAKTKVVAKPAAKSGLLAYCASLPKKRKITYICLVVVALLLLSMFAWRGWYRTTVIPKTVGMVQLGSVRSTLRQQKTDLQDPLARLGFSSVRTGHKCSLQQAQSVHTQVYCDSLEYGYVVLPSRQADVVRLQTEAVALDSQLTASGWKSGSNGVTLASLIKGTAHGQDYSADAYYEKVVGNTDCTFDVMIAYANPNPPAITANLDCNKTVNVMGAPDGLVYESSKGHF